SAFAQTARVKGIILDETNTAVAGVNVVSGEHATATNENGFYQLIVPAGKEITITFTHMTLKKSVAKFNLKPNEDLEFNFVMLLNNEQLPDIVMSNTIRKRVEGISVIPADVVRKIPGANAGVENIIKSLPGASGNNELSIAYSVRGGNYDENLVYVNEVEVYRPFLIRSGQQEGLSFTNTDLVQNVDFSAGGFQAKYGDKLSS